MFNNISFEFPYIFILIVLFLICSIVCKAKSPSYLVPHLKIYIKSNQKNKISIIVLKYIIIIFSVIALASPVKVTNTQLIQNDGINIVLNLDASASMKYNDLNKEDKSQNRFDVVKEIVSEFIHKRIVDNIALVLFGDSAMIASPLSFDKESQKEVLKYLEIGMLGGKTALIDSIAVGVNILKDKKAKSNIIILLSDGEDTASKIPLNVIIRLLKKYNIKVYTISIGNANRFILSKISKESNAKSYTAYSKEELKLIYEDINKLEKSKIDQNKLILKDYLFFYPLFISIIALVLFIFIRNKE